MSYEYTFRNLFFKEVSKTKGMVNCHGHLDRAYTMTPEIWEQASALMEEKWVLNNEIKRKHTEESLIGRISYCVEDFIKQGCIASRTFVDADNIVGMLCVNSAAKVREKYKGKFTLELMPQPLEGFLNNEGTGMDKAKMDLFEEACDVCDVVGGLPSRDRRMPGGDRKHAEFILSVAKNLGKKLDVHIDQENNPEEKDTEWFLDMAKKYKMEGRINLVHAISTACQPAEDRKRIYSKMADLGASVIVTPWAEIGMKQHRDKMAPVHNSIPQVDELIEAGVNVAIGTDNISDMMVPEDRGDIYEEILLLASACRFYDIEKLAEIATINGYKILNQKP